nr:MAG TPA: hypothetical protein [Caudoviricetes sp.]
MPRGCSRRTPSADDKVLAGCRLFFIFRRAAGDKGQSLKPNNHNSRFSNRCRAGTPAGSNLSGAASWGGAGSPRPRSRGS